ncbi:MAG: hypothetical protein IJ088_12185 [Clostridia bacterium]|nr:hypothetical protein [Clostridia bacterium]
MKVKKLLTVAILALSLLCLFLPALAQADAGQKIQRVTIRHERNVAAYSRPTGHSRFLGWAKMSQQYNVLDRVRGDGTKSHPWWYLIELGDGQQAYIPENLTSPVIENVEERTVGYVWINPQQNLLIHRKPRSHSAQMGWARKMEVYPLLSKEKTSGYWEIAMPDGTLGYVSAKNAFPYDPVEDAKTRWVYLPQRCLIREHPSSVDSPVLTGIGPGETLRCVYVYKKVLWYDDPEIWYEVETKSGGYGFIHSSVCELIEGDKPALDAAGNPVRSNAKTESTATPAEAQK